MLADSFNQLHPQNPVTSKLSATEILMDPHHIIKPCLHHPWSGEFTKLNLEKKLSWKKFIKDKLMEEEKTSGTALHKYILPISRLPNGMDKAFLIQDPIQVKLAMRWRTNTFLFGKQCPKGHPMTRGCLIRCDVIPETKKHLLEDNQFKCEQEDLLQELPTSTYSIVDHLLNHSQFEEFHSVVTNFH